MGMGSGFMKLVDHVRANEFLNLEGKQFSKSTGWYVDAREALEDFGADPLRFYLSSILPETGDSSFSWDAFQKSYKEFNNKIGNFVHRSFSFQYKNWPEGLSPKAYERIENIQSFTDIKLGIESIIEEMDRCNLNKAYGKILALGQSANEFFQSKAPWKEIKENKERAEKTMAASSLYVIAMASLLYPFTPELAQKLRKMFEGFLCKEDFSRIYMGDLSPIPLAFKKGFRLKEEPTILLQSGQMEEKLKKWKEKLESLVKKN